MRRCEVVRVFTRRSVGGNHLGIVSDVSGLDDVGMQAIATDLGFSETIFIDGDQVRIFTPTVELPFAGHPLVGAAWFVHTGTTARPDVLVCGIGPVGIEWDGIRAWVSVPLLQRVTVRDDFDPDRLGLEGVVSVAQVEMPLPYLVVELDGSDRVAAYTPDRERLAAHPDGRHFSIWARRADGRIHTRFFATEMGILEDPATGSAAVALAAELRRRGETTGDYELAQGEEVGSPSDIALSWRGEQARLGGTVVHDEQRELLR